MKMMDYLKLLLESKTETEVLEFKEAKNTYNKDKLGQYFSALGNEANLRGKDYAYVLFGVKNDRSIVGTDISDIQINEFKKEMADHTSPRLSFSNVHRVDHPDGHVLVFEIPAAPQGTPICWKGHRYGRDGESLGGLNDREYELIKANSTRIDWTKELVKGATYQDLDQAAIAKARKEFTAKNQPLTNEIMSWNDAVFLNKAKLCIDGKITRTAILLLGKSESEHFLNPGTSRITWILKDRDNLEKDYAHFTCPLILEVEKVYAKIRNLKYRYLPFGSLFPDEVDQFDPYIIREALNNAIVHQDYALGGKINVVENEDGMLTFINSGSFIPGNVEKVIEADAPENVYRNPFLAHAMVNLNMIDTVGSGIKRMFVIQKNKYFPLPEYDFENNKVKVQIVGKVEDVDYAIKLAQLQDLSLHEIILLDKVSKHKTLSENEIKTLKQRGLIEGRKPNFHISSRVAKATDEKASYIKQRGFKDDHYKKLIIEYISKYGKASKEDIDSLILDILPRVLDEDQKANKVRNIVYAMSKRDQTIVNQGTTRFPKWILSSSKPV